MVAQVRGVKFTGRPLIPDDAGAVFAAVRDIAEHLEFIDDFDYLRALPRLKQTIFDRATRTKWQKGYADA